MHGNESKTLLRLGRLGWYISVRSDGLRVESDLIGFQNRIYDTLGELR